MTRKKIDLRASKPEQVLFSSRLAHIITITSVYDLQSNYLPVGTFLMTQTFAQYKVAGDLLDIYHVRVGCPRLLPLAVDSLTRDIFRDKRPADSPLLRRQPASGGFEFSAGEKGASTRALSCLHT